MAFSSDPYLGTSVD